MREVRETAFNCKKPDLFVRIIPKNCKEKKT